MDGEGFERTGSFPFEKSWARVDERVCVDIAQCVGLSHSRSLWGRRLGVYLPFAHSP